MHPVIRSISGFSCLALLYAAIGGPDERPFVVEDIAVRAGLSFKQNNFATEAKYPFETMGGGVAALDFNNDGFLDLFFLNGAPSPSHLKSDSNSLNRLYKNNGDGLTFTDVTDKSGIGTYKGRTMGVTAADYDGDGFPDVYVANDKTENFLFHNKHDGTFEEIAGDLGVAFGQGDSRLPAGGGGR